MKIVLNPIDDQSMSPIRIEDDLFSIGRREEPFVSQSEDKSGRLSRRHARIFVENGRCFVADLGSLNGTFLNHERLTEDGVELSSGDELNLGGEFRFSVQIEQDPADDRTIIARQPPIRLSLKCGEDHPELETIVIGSFPFLVSRKHETFDRLKEILGDEVQKISRRHAVIVLKGGRPYVEDLDSANSTFLNGERLDERSRPLHDGDTLAFGDGIFSYAVRIESLTDDQTLIAQPSSQQMPQSSAVTAPDPAGAEEAVASTSITEPTVDTAPEIPAGGGEPLSAEPEASRPEDEVEKTVDPLAPEKTRFIDSATSFLDVFYDDDDDEEAPEDDDQNFKGTEKHRRKRASRVAAAADAFGGKSAINSKVVIGAIVSFALIATVGTYTYLQDAERRAVEALFEDGVYAESARKANDYLTRGGENEEIARLGEEALLKSLAPEWLPLVAEGRFEEAERDLENARVEFSALPRAASVFELLGWATDMAEHMDERPDRDSPIELFNHETTIASLVARWDGNALGYERLSRQISAYDDDIAAFMAESMSDMRQLREQDSIYGASIRAFKERLANQLQSGDIDAAQVEIAEFGRRYPRILGVGELEADVSSFDELVSAYEERNLSGLAAAQTGLSMRTELVQEIAARWLDGVLPEASTLDQFSEANRAWNDGDGDRAIDLLRHITGSAWSEVAEQEAERIEEISGAFAFLESQRAEAGHGARLLDFWQLLTPTDTYYLEAIRADFEDHESEIRGAIVNHVDGASAAWRAFQMDGGIKGVLRVEETISNTFRTQAGRLSEAYANSSAAVALARSIKNDFTPTEQSLHTEIQQEAARQRRWLEDLRIVLDPEVLDAKLTLLPIVTEES